MSALRIHRFPDPILTRSARRVARLDRAMQRLIQGMLAVMRSQPRCVGLAAPQIGHAWRVAVMDASVHPHGPPDAQRLVLVNPSLELLGERDVRREGCLSVPDLTGNVARHRRVRLTAQDASGAVYERLLEGFEAVVAQHEVDHLDGILFLDRVTNPARDVFKRKTSQ